MKFELKSQFKPTGDQPQAIERLSKLIKNGSRHNVLLGVTGSGKTFTMANVIANLQRPTLIISHNKTLAAQLYQEFKEFFPNNAVSYFVSYYDYYQPEAYMPTTDTYIEKETQINEELDKLRLAATTNLMTRKDVIVVASVSCIYNIGSPVEYGRFMLELKKDSAITQKDVLFRLSDLQYERNDYAFKRGSYRLRGDSIDIFPAYQDIGIRVEFSERKIKQVSEFNPLTGDVKEKLSEGAFIYPAKHYMVNPATYPNAFSAIRHDLGERIKFFRKNNKLVEAQRIESKVNHDLDMIRELGYVNGIENYSRYFDGRRKGEPPFTLLEYFKKCSNDLPASGQDFLCFIDESHNTVPQIRGMYNGDRARKETLIEYGFRLPSAFDNRPLRFDEFMERVNALTYVSATPDEYEISLATENPPAGGAVVEQLIRPTGLIDPKITVKSTAGQIDDLIKLIEARVAKKQRVLVTTLTKRMSEDLAAYLEEKGIKVAYLHSDIETLERQDILDELRLGTYDVLVGINLLREGLDLPEVSLVVILDADKEGFLRSRTSLIQTMGRASRHIDGEVILYADNITGSMKAAIDEIERRRNVQLEYNKKHNITPKSIQKGIREKLIEARPEPIDILVEFENKEVLLPDEKEKLIKKLRQQMKEAAKELDFETAVLLRDRIRLVRDARR